MPLHDAQPNLIIERAMRQSGKKNSGEQTGLLAMG